MNHQSNESHLGFTSETPCAIDRNSVIGQFDFDNSGRIVIPQIGRDHQPVQYRGGQNAEVSEPGIESDNHAMDGSVKLVEELEDQAFRAQSSRGEDHLAFTFANELF
jgi:hypothetical protein